MSSFPKARDNETLPNKRYRSFAFGLDYLNYGKGKRLISQRCGQGAKTIGQAKHMRRVTSSYKIFGGFGLFILLNGLIGIGTFKLLTTVDMTDLMNNSNTQKVYAFVLGLQLFFLYLFSTQNRFIIADSDGITFINPILPFLRSTYRWTDFDYYVTVDESSQHSTHEAVWLIKDKRLKARFSSFYYSNYDDLIDQVKTTSKGDKYFNPFDQLFILMGLKGVKDK